MEKRFNEYRFDFEVICKEILIDGAKETKMVKSKEKLSVLAKKVEWFYGFVEDTDVDDKDRLLGGIAFLTMNVKTMICYIERFLETWNFTDYFEIVKWCVRRLNKE